MGTYQVARARLNRAIGHGNQLASLWNAVPAGRLCTPRARIGPNGIGHLLATSVGAIPEELALLLGEMLYQLRSALDACIYQTTIYATKQDPPPDEGKLEFPITSDPKEWPNLVKRRLSALPKDIQDAIERVQPYNNLSIPPEQMVHSINRSLGILHDLSRKDRHRKLHVIGSWPLNLAPEFILPDGVTMDWMEIQPPSVLREGAVLAKFRLSNFATGLEAAVNPRLRTNFGCDEPPVACHPTDTFDTRLTEMINAVGSVIIAFERQY